MNDIGDRIGAMIAAFISLAVLAIVVSNSANTVNVLGSFFSGISNLIGVAISPITGQSVSGLNASGTSASGLTGGNWQNGSSGFTVTPSNATGAIGSILGNAGGSFLNSLLSSAGSGTSGTSGTSTGLLGNLLGGGGGGGSQDFIDSGTF